MTRKADHNSIGFATSGGLDTSRVPKTTDPDQLELVAQRNADVLAALTRRGLADGDESVAAILGLLDGPSALSRRVDVRVPMRQADCCECGAGFRQVGRSRTCSDECRARLAAKTRKGNLVAAEASAGAAGGGPADATAAEDAAVRPVDEILHDDEVLGRHCPQCTQPYTPAYSGQPTCGGAECVRLHDLGKRRVGVGYRGAQLPDIECGACRQKFTPRDAQVRMCRPCVDAMVARVLDTTAADTAAGESGSGGVR